MSTAVPAPAQGLMQTAFHHAPVALTQGQVGAAANVAAQAVAQPVSPWYASLLKAVPETEPAPAVAATGRSAAAAVLRLAAQRERGRIVDFIWQHATPAAARLLRVGTVQPIGKSLRQLSAGPLMNHPALIERYRRVMEDGSERSFAQVHLVKGRQDVVIHRVSCSGDTVTVSLTNLSADRRAQARRLGVTVPDLPPPPPF